MFRQIKCFLYLVLCFQSLKGQLPPDFSDQIISDEWNLPLGMAFDENGNMFVWEKAGRVYRADSSGTKIEPPILDIQEEVGNWRDHGLLGFTLDPNFINNGHFYLLYAVDRHHLLNFGTSQYHPDSSSSFQASIGRVCRFTADPANDFTTLIPNSRRVLLGESISTGFPLYHESHGVGSLVFGEDGTLLVSCGDGNSNQGVDIGGNEFGSYAEQALNDGIISPEEDMGSFKSQYLGSLGGKVLRIDPETGDGIPSNPFYDPDNPRAAISRIWAYGFRNPYKMILVENTGSHNPEEGNPGTLMIGDVGASQWEELNIARSGGLNFGWPFKEGLIPFWGFWNSTAPESPLAPNPLFGSGCSQEFFNLRDLYAEARSDNTGIFPNPCNNAVPIPESAYPRMETLPVLTWGHNEYNLPTKTFVPVFDTDGSYSATDISSADSPIESDLFDGNSSIAGTFYKGDNFPEYYRGLYFHADYSGWIKVMHFGEDFKLEKIEPFHDDSRQIIQLIEHPINGCLYYISFRNGGSIHKICYGGNPPPIARINADTIYGTSPLTVQFDASQSYDPFGLPITYHWDFGDGTESTDIAPSHQFVSNSSAPSPFVVKLTVTDSLEVEGMDEIIISLNNTPPEVEIINPRDSSFYSMKGNTIYRLDAEVSDIEHSDSELTYEWQTALHHNSHNHPEAPSYERNPLAVITPAGCEIDATYWFRVRLTVSDAAGLQTTKEVDIFPYCGPDFFSLGNLQADVNESSVVLNWDIISEDDVLHYEIQRSPFFETIGIVAASGIGDYSFTDTAPMNGDNFYRIKAVRPDGVFDYSNSVKASFPPKGDFVLYPNPARDMFTIEMSRTKSELISLELYDTAGKQLINSQWITNQGVAFKQSIITQALSKGLYFYRVKDGESTNEGTLMIR